MDPLRNGGKATALAQRANELDRGNPIILRTLAAAYAETGKFKEAIETAQSALSLAVAQGNTRLSNTLEAQIKLHQAGLPMRDESQIKP
ncbi:MAG TPA: hypothetical protein VFC44_11940 [Candidatus Saccharimonadales bacterium]|nr:hypothetical protein [Candidatus Saccharimonadales bacterium]